MATLEELKAQNNELAQKVQYWKMTAAQRDDEKLALMKEINELRLKLSRLRNTGGFEAKKLDAALQSASEKALSYLVQASAEITTSMEIAKAYFRDRQELDAQSPRWSSIGGTPATDKSDRVHRVPPLMMGGHSIQPVVSLSRTVMNTSSSRTTSRSPNQNRSITERAVPMHMLQDVYIPLTRIDMSDLPNNNMETDSETNNPDDSTQNLGLEDDRNDSDVSDGHISEEDEYDSRRKLHDVSEEDNEMLDIEPVTLMLDRYPRYDRVEDRRDANQMKIEGGQMTSQENPLEGPSWMLDRSYTASQVNTPQSRLKLEPDSTTELDTSRRRNENTEGSPAVCAFSPTVRRRKRTSTPPATPTATPRPPHYSPRPAACRRNSTSGRVLKVLVAKMTLDGAGGVLAHSSPCARTRSPELLGALDAPSPNGATDSRVIVSEARIHTDDVTALSRTSRLDSHERRRARTSQDSQRASRPGHDVRNNSVDRGADSDERGNSGDRRTNYDSDSIISQHRSRAARHEARDSARDTHDASHVSQDSHDSSRHSRDTDGGGDVDHRTRRARKPVTYKEKTLKAKLRR